MSWAADNGDGAYNLIMAPASLLQQKPQRPEVPLLAHTFAPFRSCGYAFLFLVCSEQVLDAVDAGELVPASWAWR